jgi:hypothetical protein
VSPIKLLAVDDCEFGNAQTYSSMIQTNSFAFAIASATVVILPSSCNS